jgi:hypothetical protein
MADESKTAAAKSPARKSAAAKKSPARKSRAKSQKRDENTSTRTKEKAGVGTAVAPEKTPIPEEVKIPREAAKETGTKISTTGPEVQGDQALQIIDNTMSRPVHVSLIEGKALTPDTDGRLIFVQGPVSNDLMPIAAARSKFAVKKDGTAIYNARGFDDVAAGADFDLLDIEKLIEHNHRKGKSRK